MEGSINTKKQTKGRQKIEMKMIEDDDDRLITFSKRRSGIYKKASELVTLCGADVAVVIFSPSGKPFAYGSPSVDSVAARFLHQNPLPPPPYSAVDTAAPPPPFNNATHPIVEAHRRVRINELSQQYNDLFAHLEAEKERRKELQRLAAAPSSAALGSSEGWWDAELDGLSLEELKRKQSSLEELHASISNHVKERVARSNFSVSAPPRAPAPLLASEASSWAGPSRSEGGSEPFVAGGRLPPRPPPPFPSGYGPYGYGYAYAYAYGHGRGQHGF